MRFISFLFSLVYVFVSLIGCQYEKRVHVWSVFHASTWGPSGDKFAFARGYKIYKAPVGLSRFPDGGRSKSLHESISFYVYDIKSGTIQMIDHFDDAKNSTARILWNITINWEGDIITYSLVNRVWDRDQKKHRVIDKGHFSFDVTRNEKIPLSGKEKKEKAKIRPGRKKRGRMSLSARDIKNYTRNVAVEGWGIDPLNYSKLSTGEYIEDLMALEGDQEYRNAVIERLGKELKTDEIKKLLEEFRKEMDKLRRSDNYKYLKYKYSIDEIEKRLRDLLQGAEKSDAR
jgi:hypothetical protein